MTACAGELQGGVYEFSPFSAKKNEKFMEI
jgi:hypothetical protein